MIVRFYVRWVKESRWVLGIRSAFSVVFCTDFRWVLIGESGTSARAINGSPHDQHLHQCELQRPPMGLTNTFDVDQFLGPARTSAATAHDRVSDSWLGESYLQWLMRSSGRSSGPKLVTSS